MTTHFEIDCPECPATHEVSFRDGFDGDTQTVKCVCGAELVVRLELEAHVRVKQPPCSTAGHRWQQCTFTFPESGDAPGRLCLKCDAYEVFTQSGGGAA